MLRPAHVLVLVVAACGVELGDPPDVETDDGKSDGAGSGSGSGGGMTMTLTATGFLGKVGIQYCNESFRCKATYPGGELFFTQDFGSTVQICYAGADAFYGPGLVEQSITAGRVLYSAVAATACAAGIMYPADCATFWQIDATFPASCDTALVGTIADGGTCVSIFDCANPSSACDSTTKKCTRVL